MEQYNISGIQQVGIGVQDMQKAWDWYAQHFGMDLPIFNDEAEASLMKEYTGGKAHKRRAVLAMNLQGGGGFEVWQFTSRKPTASPKVEEGDLGITSIHMRAKDIKVAHDYFDKLDDTKPSKIQADILNRSYFELDDPFGNSFKIIEDDYQFMKTSSVTGGVIGVTFGVSNMENALNLFQEAFNYSKIEGRSSVDGIERVCLRLKDQKESAFSQLLGPTTIEIVCDSTKSRPITFKDRFWGDLGFIHCCFDVQKMGHLREKCNKINSPFTVDSENSFDMGEAAGQFAYVETEDKTLIELVETHKVPIMKKIGWYINLKNKKVQSPLPRFIFKALSMNRVKFN